MACHAASWFRPFPLPHYVFPIALLLLNKLTSLFPRIYPAWLVRCDLTDVTIVTQSITLRLRYDIHCRRLSIARVSENDVSTLQPHRTLSIAQSRTYKARARADRLPLLPPSSKKKGKSPTPTALPLREPMSGGGSIAKFSNT